MKLYARHSFLGPFVLAVVSACGSSSSEEAETNFFGGLVRLDSKQTPFAVVPEAPVAIGPAWMTYLADEASSGASDLNGDGDALDRVAVAFELRHRLATPLRAARAVELVGNEVYLTTLEADDGKDWSGDGMQDDLVLLHWSGTRAMVTFVAAIEEAPPFVVADRLYFSDASDTLPAILGATKLEWVSGAAPTSPERVLAASALFGPDPRPFAQDEGLLFLVQDERVEQQDLNGDADASDERVLALLDARAPDSPLLNTGLAQAPGTPVRALATVGRDRLVAFLVDETAQGQTNLNDPASGELQPPHCAGHEDTDVLDQVLHFLFLESWTSDPAGFPPVNTGLAGSARVLALESADGTRHLVGTIAREQDEGTCSLNDDADLDDTVARWIEVAPGGVVFRPVPARFVALHDAPGGAHGVAEVDGRFVAILSEAGDGRDLSGDPAKDVELLAWIDPFAHQGAPEDWQLITRTRDAEWMTQQPGAREIVVTVHEFAGDPTSCDRDDDFDDSYAVFGRFEEGEPRWNHYCYATERFNAGQVLIGDVAFFRADETEQDRDINEDGDILDQVLLRHRVFPLQRLNYVWTLNGLASPAVFRGTGDVAAFLEDEAQSRHDGNRDGDKLDLVLRTVSLR